MSGTAFRKRILRAAVFASWKLGSSNTSTMLGSACPWIRERLSETCMLDLPHHDHVLRGMHRPHHQLARVHPTRPHPGEPHPRGVGQQRIPMSNKEGKRSAEGVHLLLRRARTKTNNEEQRREKPRRRLWLYSKLEPIRAAMAGID